MEMSLSDAVSESVNQQREMVEKLFEQIAEASRGDPGITRAPYGPDETFAHNVMSARAADLGLEIRTDAAANTYMTLPGRDRALPPIITGSHLDSVARGGNFDGAAGVLAGLTAIAAIRKMGLTPARDITVMSIRAEESVWFQVSYLGSRGALGMLPDGALDVRRVDSGRTLAEHIAECGGDPDALRRGERYLDPAKKHFVESPYKIETFVDNEAAADARAILDKAGKEFKREPGLVIRRATLPSDTRFAVYEITFWQQFKTYAIVQKDYPLKYRLLESNEAVRAGDLWCHQGKEHREWLPAKLFGGQLPYNDYCRKLF